MKQATIMTVTQGAANVSRSFRFITLSERLGDGTSSELLPNLACPQVDEKMSRKLGPSRGTRNLAPQKTHVMLDLIGVEVIKRGTLRSANNKQHTGIQMPLTLPRGTSSEKT